MLYENLNKYRRSTRNVLFASLMVVAAVMVYRQIVVPHRVCLYAAQRHDNALMSVAAHNEKLLDAIRREKQRLDNLRTDYIRLKKRVCIADGVERFAAELQAMSERAGCTVYSVNILAEEAGAKGKKASKKSDLKASTVQLSFVGQYGDIVELMSALESYGGKVWADSIKMKILNKESSQVRCDMSITVYTADDGELRLNV